MPDFSRAQVSEGAQDLTQYKTFLKKLAVGQVVTLPLEQGESSRAVVRSLNSAAQQSDMRLTRLPSQGSAIRFRVASPQKRRVNISAEARKARAQKAQATRAAKRGTTAPRRGR